MQLNDLTAVPDPTEPDVSHLTPDERRREIATLLAAGVLRLLTRRETLPKTPDSGPKNAPLRLSKFGDD